MSQQQRMQRVARVLRRNPWMVVAAWRVWRLTRPRFTMGVVGVIFNASGHVLLVEHVFHPYLPWGLPGGWVERQEDPAVSLRREMREELALDVEVGAVVAVELVAHTHVDLAYRCFTRGEIGALSYELLDYGWFDPQHLPGTHLFHQIAIQRAQAALVSEETYPA